MNRQLYYNYIEEKLHVLAYRIETGGKLNMLSLHMHSENFYLYFFNLLYDYTLENLNRNLQNVEAIDLIDHTNKIVVQVSSTNTKSKVESALNKKIISTYPNHTFKFISISKGTSKLKTKTFKNPYSISFNPITDIHDIESILGNVLTANPDKQKEIYRFIQKELGSEVDIIKLDSNLAGIINILATEQWGETGDSDSINAFQIDRKIEYNDLDLAKDIIEEYSIYYTKVDTKYSEFDSLGINKSRSVLSTIRREYIKIKNHDNADQIFFAVIDAIKNKILESSNHKKMPIDELDLCVDILVVDAFIRCKIFKNPTGYNHVTS